MEIYVYNKSLELVGISDQVSSLMWTKRFPLGDAFTISAPANPNNCKLFRPQMIIEIPGRYSGIITYRNISSTNGVISISGVSFDGMLGSRAISDALYTDSLLSIVDKNVGLAAADARRRFECTYVDKSVDVATINRDSITYANLSDYATNICNENAFLIRSEIVHGENNKIRIYGRYGIDRSINQDVNEPVVFSDLYGNVSTMDAVYSEEGGSNGAFIYSEPQQGENGEWTVSGWSGIFGDTSGFARREGVYQIVPYVKYVARSNGSSVEWIKVLDEEKTAQRAADHFKEVRCEFTDCVESAVLIGADYTKRFDVGDIVTVYSSRFGISEDLRVTEISESFTENGLAINATFGEPMKCLKQMIGG